jgi:hypothetical protein
MNMLKGIALMFACTLGFSVLSALFFRFPIPLGGLIGPFGELQDVSAVESIKAAALAWAMYTALAAGLPQVVGGALLGRLAAAGNARPAILRRRLLLGTAALSLVMVLALATLDWFIGPW